MLEEARQHATHRKLGREPGPVHNARRSAGQIFLRTPTALATFYTELQDYMARNNAPCGYVRVKTPQVRDRKLWEAPATGEIQDHMLSSKWNEEHAREIIGHALNR